MKKPWIVVLVAAIVIIGALLIFGRRTPAPNNNDNTTPPPVAFSQDGNLAQNNPGFKSGVWYLVYDLPGAPATTKELDLQGQSYPLRNGMRAHVDGTEASGVVTVSTLTILSPHNDDLIWVSSPQANDTINSPLNITGEARGSWYFEAVFPVKLIDSSGKTIAQGQAQAQGSWTTSDYVPFTATLTFNQPSKGTGTLVLQKDNPSGLTQNDNSLQIPVQFPGPTQSVKLYYYNANNDKDASGNILCSKQGLVAVNRTIPKTITPIQDTIKLLIEGKLTAPEKSQGLTTEYPLPGLSLTSANLSGGTLTLQFADPQNQTGGGSCRVSVLWAQIDATAKQFSGVTSVKFKPDSLFQP